MSEAAAREREAVDEAIEFAAQRLAEDDRLTVTFFVDRICGAHPDWSTEIVGRRIKTRRDEICMFIAAAAARFERDICDRAGLVLSGEQLLIDACAAIAAAYPDKGTLDVMARLEAKVRELGAQDA